MNQELTSTKFTMFKNICDSVNIAILASLNYDLTKSYFDL